MFSLWGGCIHWTVYERRHSQSWELSHGCAVPLRIQGQGGGCAYPGMGNADPFVREWRAVPLLCSPSQATHSSRQTPLFSTFRLHRGLADSSPVSPRPPTLVMASVQAQPSSLDFSHNLLPDLPAVSLPGPIHSCPERQSEPLLQN